MTFVSPTLQCNVKTILYDQMCRMIYCTMFSFVFCSFLPTANNYIQRQLESRSAHILEKSLGTKFSQPAPPGKLKERELSKTSVLKIDHFCHDPTVDFGYEILAAYTTWKAEREGVVKNVRSKNRSLLP